MPTLTKIATLPSKSEVIDKLCDRVQRITNLDASVSVPAKWLVVLLAADEQPADSILDPVTLESPVITEATPVISDAASDAAPEASRRRRKPKTEAAE